MSITTRGLIYNTEVQTFISSTHQHVAQILKDYNQYLDVVFIPEAHRPPNGALYAIVDRSPEYDDHVVRLLTEADMMDPAGILTWVFDGDVRRHGAVSVFKTIELREKAEQMLKLKAWEDESEQRQSEVAFLVSGGRERRNTVRFNGKKIEVA